MWLVVICGWVWGGHVTELNETTFDKYVADHPYSMITFYAAWCEHCKEFEPEFEYIAKTMTEQGSRLSFARIDANVHYAIREKQKIRRFPTLRIYINGTMIDYRRGAVAGDIIPFINRKLQQKVLPLRTKEELILWQKRKPLQVLLISSLLRPFSSATTLTS